MKNKNIKFVNKETGEEIIFRKSHLAIPPKEAKVIVGNKVYSVDEIIFIPKTSLNLVLLNPLNVDELNTFYNSIDNLAQFIDGDEELKELFTVKKIVQEISSLESTKRIHEHRVRILDNKLARGVSYHDGYGRVVNREKEVAIREERRELQEQVEEITEKISNLKKNNLD